MSGVEDRILHFRTMVDIRAEVYEGIMPYITKSLMTVFVDATKDIEGPVVDSTAIFCFDMNYDVPKYMSVMGFTLSHWNTGNVVYVKRGTSSTVTELEKRNKFFDDMVDKAYMDTQMVTRFNEVMIQPDRPEYKGYYHYKPYTMTETKYTDGFPSTFINFHGFYGTTEGSLGSSTADHELRLNTAYVGGNHEYLDGKYNAHGIPFSSFLSIEKYDIVTQRFDDKARLVNNLKTSYARLFPKTSWTQYAVWED